MRGFDHLHDFQARIGRHRVMPEIRETAGGVVVDRKSAGKLIGLRAALAPSLHSALAADRHDATLLTAQHAARESEIDDRLDVIDAEFMLREVNAVDDYCGARARVYNGELLHFAAREPGALLQHFPGLLLQRGFELGESCRMFADKLLIDAVQCDQRFQYAVDKSDIATDPHLKKFIHEFVVEQRALCDRRNTVALKADFYT